MFHQQVGFEKVPHPPINHPPTCASPLETPSPLFPAHPRRAALVGTIALGSKAAAVLKGAGGASTLGKGVTALLAAGTHYRVAGAC